jgi:hypothetical protein
LLLAATQGRCREIMRRHLLGLIAVALLVSGTLLWIWPPSAAHMHFLHGSCIKAGAVLLSVWLAYPHLQRVPGWAFVAIALGAVALAAWPRGVLPLLRYGALLLPLVLVLWLLRPRPPRRTPGPVR